MDWSASLVAQRCILLLVLYDAFPGRDAPIVFHEQPHGSFRKILGVSRFQIIIAPVSYDMVE